MSRKISHTIIGGRTVVGTGGQGLKIGWFQTNLGNLHWLDVDESTLEAYYLLAGTNYGYAAGGYNNPAGDTDSIDKWSLSSDANATDVGNLTRSLGAPTIAGSSSSTHGYAAGGLRAGVQWYDIIEKWTFASDANATDVGDVTVAREQPAGCSSATHGYCVGGYNGGYSNVIDKVSTSSDGNATDVGDLATNANGGAPSSSTSHGYNAGGIGSGDAHLDHINKFTFASDANATDIANLTRVKSTPCCGATSSTHGYAAGGRLVSGAASVDDIDKYAHASDANATDVGNLVVDRYNSTGAQY